MSAAERAGRWQQSLLGFWGRTSFLTPFLLPAAALYAALAARRRRRQARRARVLPVPTVVVGNLGLGGTGKTPLVLCLVSLLQGAGYRPGLVSRGWKGRARGPRLVRPEDSPAEVGDEALLLAAAAPTAIGVDRGAAAALLVAAGCELVLCDDGLQHYALARDLEVAVVDGARGLGNRRCLPAGPLREPPSRLEDADIVVWHGEKDCPQDAVPMSLAPRRWLRLDGAAEAAIERLPGALEGVHAVAGLGNPQRFFNTLRSLGLGVTEHVFPDHHPYCENDLCFADSLPVVMTEKDAVKCRLLPGLDKSRCWSLRAEAVLPADFAAYFLQLLAERVPLPRRAA